MSVDCDGEVVDESRTENAVDLPVRRLWLVALMVVLAAMLGVIGCFVDEESSYIDLLVGMPLLVSSIAWCFVDAKQRGHRIGRVMKLLLVLFFALALPIYLIQTRGWRGLITLLQAVGVAFGLGLAAEAAQWGTLLLGDWMGWWWFVP
jgi:hypothetical protein